MQIKVKTNSIEPLIEAVLNDFFTPAAAPHVKNEYELTVVMDKDKVNFPIIITPYRDFLLKGFKVEFKISIPRLKFTAQYDFHFCKEFEISKALQYLSLNFAAYLYLDLHHKQGVVRNYFQEGWAKKILQPILDKLEPMVYANFIPRKPAPAGVINIL